MPKIVQLPVVTHRNAYDLIQRIANSDTNRITFSTHGEDQMIARGVSRIQVHRCLQQGTEADIELDNNTGCYKVKLAHRSAGVWLQVVAALEEDELGGLAVVVTVIA